jgi:hypothetical protein
MSRRRVPAVVVLVQQIAAVSVTSPLATPEGKAFWAEAMEAGIRSNMEIAKVL